MTRSSAVAVFTRLIRPEVYGDIRDQAIKASERWHDARVNIIRSGRKVMGHIVSGLERMGRKGLSDHAGSP